MAATIVATGFVTGVNQPGNGSFTEVTVGYGDVINATTYKPTETQDPRLPAGLEYNLFMLGLLETKIK